MKDTLKKYLSLKGFDCKIVTDYSEGVVCFETHKGQKIRLSGFGWMEMCEDIVKHSGENIKFRTLAYFIGKMVTAMNRYKSGKIKSKECKDLLRERWAEGSEYLCSTDSERLLTRLSYYLQIVEED